MVLTSAEIRFYLSGGSTNTDPNSSLGGSISSTEVPNQDTGSLHNLFDRVTGAEAQGGDTEYRCIYIKNIDTSGRTLYTAEVYIDTQPDSRTTKEVIYMGLDPAGKNGTATSIANEDTAPTGVTFSQPTSSNPLSLGDLAPNDYYPIWIMRSVPANTEPTGTAGATVKIGITGDSVA